MNISKFIELTKWFNRKSQHYVLGNWAAYTKSENKLFWYYLNYPRAYCKFMWLSRSEFLG